jgi:hypothetical protein
LPAYIARILARACGIKYHINRYSTLNINPTFK